MNVEKAKEPSKPQAPEVGGKLSFNHAMVYVKDVQRALEFYRDLLGFKMVDEFRHEGKPVYARLRAPGGDGTVALHMAGPGTSLASEGVRLYFEIRELDDFCRKLQAKHFYITQMPRMMPWGWRHAYLNDLLGRREPHEEDRHAGGERGREDPSRQGTLTENIVPPRAASREKIIARPLSRRLQGAHQTFE